MSQGYPKDLITQTVTAVRPLDQAAMTAARDRQARMTKPAGSLGALEEISVRLAGLAGHCPPPVPEPAAVAVFAGDHGVHAQGVTPWPREVTAQMVRNFLAGGAVVNAFAAQARAEVVVVDVGVDAELVPDHRRHGYREHDGLGGAGLRFHRRRCGHGDGPRHRG